MLAGLEAAAAYRKAMTNFQDACAELQRQTNALKTFASAVARAPGSVTFADLASEGDSFGTPAASAAQWTARDFPSPATLQATLCLRNSARQDLLNLWSQMPAAVRQKFTPPPRS
ncbi:hypothetical protein ACFOD9_03900 [Novosphingobium bradum]|uniref:Uncharacterized protein n=2 Tax=Novosphingobium bradum TaxID=1737444 RepID=A0ABV7IL34_9SPHN